MKKAEAPFLDDSRELTGCTLSSGGKDADLQEPVLSTVPDRRAKAVKADLGAKPPPERDWHGEARPHVELLKKFHEQLQKTATIEDVEKVIHAPT